MSIISEEELREVVEVVWMTVLDIPVDVGRADNLASCETTTAQISITGAWNGVVLVKASERFLSQAAAFMFSSTMDAVDDNDRSETLTEMTNMLGGTVKCLLPETCDLSLPSLVSDESTLGDVAWLDFTCGDHPLAVAVSEHASGAQQAA